MYLIVLPDEMKVACAIVGFREACLVAELDFPDVATDTFSNEGRYWSRYGRLALRMLIDEHNIPAPPGLFEYGAMVTAIVEFCSTIPLDRRSLAALEKAAGPRPLPGDLRAIEAREPFYQPVSVPCKGAPPSIKAAAPKIPRAPREPGAAPTKGATARVWEIAESLLAGLDINVIDVKSLRKLVIEGCEAEGLNPGTAATQFGKWKASKS